MLVVVEDGSGPTGKERAVGQREAAVDGVGAEVASGAGLQIAQQPRVQRRRHLHLMRARPLVDFLDPRTEVGVAQQQHQRQQAVLHQAGPQRQTVQRPRRQVRRVPTAHDRHRLKHDFHKMF